MQIPKLAAVLGLIAGLAGPAGADPRGADLMAKMDTALTRAKDQIFEYEMAIQDTSGSPRKLGMRIHIRGLRRHIEFLYPGDVQGLKLLIRSREQMYVYLPAYRKARRIASHVRAQSLFGADYSYDEMSTVTYADVYQPTFQKETADHYLISGKKRAGKDSPYARIVFHVRKKELLPDKLEYFNDAGKKVKTETRSNFKCIGNYCAAHTMKIVDHTRNDHWTELKCGSLKVNTGFSNKIFSRRALGRVR